MQKIVLLICGMMFNSLNTHASLITYSSETHFINETGINTFDSFEDLNSLAPSEATGFMRDGYTISVDNSSVSDFEIQATNNSSSIGFIDGQTRISFHSDIVSQSFSFFFDNPVLAFGLFLIDGPEDPDANGMFDLLFSSSNGEELVVLTGPVSNESSVFFGFNTDNPVSSVNFTLPGSSDGLALDKIYLESTDINSVSEPPMFFLVLTLLICFWLFKLKLYAHSSTLVVKL